VTIYGETSAQDQLRAMRKGTRTDGSARLIGYVDYTGQKRAVTGDEEAPYVKIVNSATYPVLVSIASGSGSLAVRGVIAHYAADNEATNYPVKIGGHANVSQRAAVAEDDVADVSLDLNGRVRVRLSAPGGDIETGSVLGIGTGDQLLGVHDPAIVLGGSAWTQFNSALSPAAASFSIAAAGTNRILGRLEITNADATACYALVYNGTSTSGTLIGRFFVPASGTAVRDYTTEGGLYTTGGIFVQLSTSPSAVSAPATGGFCHAIYQAA